MPSIEQSDAMLTLSMPRVVVCAAGRGPTSSCKHIAVTCYVLEDFYRVNHLQDHVSTTSQLQT